MKRAMAAVVLLSMSAMMAGAQEKKDDGWIVLFNGKDTTGWLLRAVTVQVTKYTDSDGKPIPGAKKTKLDQTEVAHDAKNKDIAGAKIVNKDGKKIVVDSDGKPIEKAKIAKIGGRDAIVDAKNAEVKGAKAVTLTVQNENGWTVEKGVLVCSQPHAGNDLLTDQKFTDFELHVEFQATSNSGVYLQGRYEIQINNDAGGKAGKNSGGSLYGQVAPSKNAGKKPPEWNTYQITFRAPRGKDGKVTEKGSVTVVWNGEKVIDNAEIAVPTGGALDGKVTEPGPILLQGDHGKVTFRNIKIRPLAAK